MIVWPCVFKLEGNAELMYLGSEHQLSIELNDLIWDGSDRLIDSRGHCYAVSIEKGRYAFEPDGVQLSLVGVTQLIQAHECARAQVCVTKIQFSSIEEAIKSLSWGSSTRPEI